MKSDRQITLAIDLESSGANIIIAAPGVGKCIEIDHLDFLCSGGANTVKFTVGSSTQMAKYSFDDAQGYQWDFVSLDRNGLKLADNTAFTMTLTAATPVEGLILYRINGE